MLKMASLLLGPVKALLLAALVFIPFERFAGVRPAQAVFRKGWATMPSPECGTACCCMPCC